VLSGQVLYHVSHASSSASDFVIEVYESDPPPEKPAGKSGVDLVAGM
jgi:hypothetical protein